MNKIFYVIACLSIMLLSACSSEKFESSNYKSGKVSLSATVETRVCETDKSNSTTTGMATKWAANDNILALYSYSTYASESLTTSAGDGYFLSGDNLTSDQVNGFYNNEVYAVNTSQTSNVSNSDTISAQQHAAGSSQLDATVKYMDSQDGTLGNVSHYDLVYATGSTYSSTTGRKLLQFKHQMCVLRFDLTSSSFTSSTVINNVTMSFNKATNSPSLFASQATYYYGTNVSAAPTLTYISTILMDPIVSVKLNSSNNSYYASVYVVVPANTGVSGSLSIMANDTNGNLYKSDVITISKSFSAGYMYAATTPMNEVTYTPGNYYFSDGTWGTLAEYPNKTPIGVIFSFTTTDNDKAHGYTNGYAMALKNASYGCTWSGGTYQSIDEAGAGDTYGSFTYTDYYQVQYTDFIKDREGYNETKAIENKSVYSQANYPAFYSALNYGIAAPTTTTNSGWFLPSVGQWWDIITDLGGMTSPVQIGSYWCNWYTHAKKCVDNIDQYLIAVKLSLSHLTSADLFSNDTFGDGYVRYWSSSEYSKSYSYYSHFGNYANPNVSSDPKVDVHLNAGDPRGLKSEAESMVRPIIAF